MIIETERLILRQWKDSDIDPFVKLNLDEETMKFFPSTYARDVSEKLINREIERISKDDIGLLAVELKETGEFIGFIGLARPSYETHFTPCTEIGWRIYKDFWGKGYASEGARAVLDFAFEELGLEEVVSFTSRLNLASIRVMEKIGMVRDTDGDFKHPMVEDDSELKDHVLFRVRSVNG
ncbi:putative acetyl transferase [Halobacteriovorax marinus SJ]|uniref:Acetyl transferase n=1 Tax=Halobacteriovorax marinus (strain ATCC BAA-682 / DSM 15412 / SJ) TaxID=862908 RepID=E1X5F3_HALMS|nr:GNAT family N-acetyltransferase [Halobacteriovorax marinus]CBW27274.1 putative acetyl transferase [Halobacteriovorax marinus SJ]